MNLFIQSKGNKSFFIFKDKTMDVMNMKDFQSNEFNVVIDKGTLDTILCGDNSEANVEKMLQEINRVLKSNGVYICISYGSEEQRKEF